VPRRPIVRIFVIIAVVLFALIGLTPRDNIGDEVDASTPRTRRSLVTSVITPVGRDRFSVVPLGVADATITAPMTNLDSNLREVFWEATAREVADGGACATWQSASTASLQQGIALRASSSPSGTRSILVTKNVFLGGTWVFNIDVWDTATTGLTVLKNVDLHDVFNPTGQLAPLPWRMCARARGDDVDFKVWLVGQPEPAWGDPRFGASSPLPPGWQAPGKTGWYIGHLPAGAYATYRDMMTFVL
jgi:hypothetical protein